MTYSGLKQSISNSSPSRSSNNNTLSNSTPSITPISSNSQYSNPASHYHQQTSSSLFHTHSHTLGHLRSHSSSARSRSNSVSAANLFHFGHHLFSTDSSTTTSSSSSSFSSSSTPSSSPSSQAPSPSPSPGPSLSLSISHPFSFSHSATIQTPTAPIPANVPGNKKASESSSLFQIAAQIKDRLEDVPGIPPFLEMCIGNLPPQHLIQAQLQNTSSSTPDRNSAADLSLANVSTNSSISTAVPQQSSAASASSSTTIQHTNSSLSLSSSAVIPVGMKIDPVTHLWQFFRLGSSLCALFNALQPKEPLEVAITNDVKRCKRSVYDFLQGCKSELDYSDEDIFTISNVFSDNTTDLLKVIRTVKLVLDTLESRNLITPAKNKKSSISSLRPPRDKRDKVVEEILLTERKFVQDLELLHEYQCKLQDLGVLSADTIHNLFPSLNVLIDFQRRFLIGIEYHAHLPPEEQRFGSVFLNFQEGFEVYEGFALHYKKACDIATSESAKLQPLKDILDPHYELPSFLIKPIQRICKYPLLLEQLVKYTPKDYPNYQEQVDALDAIRRVTASVNETKRRVENKEVVRDLSERLVDWKGHNVDDFGNLIHDGVFPVLKAGTEREYHLYLFENIILCCKEAPPSKKSMALSTKKNKVKRSSVLILKGRIYIAYITNVSAFVSNGYLLHIAWGRDDATDTGFFDIRFKHDEQLELWRSTIESLVAHYNDESNAADLIPVAPPHQQTLMHTQGYGALMLPSNGYLPTNSLQQYQQQQHQKQIQQQHLLHQQQQIFNAQSRQNSFVQSFGNSDVNGTSYDDDDEDDMYITNNQGNSSNRQYDEDTLAALHQGLNTLSYPIDQAQQNTPTTNRSSSHSVQHLTNDLANTHVSSEGNLRQAARQDSTASLSALHPAHHFQNMRSRASSIPPSQLGGNNANLANGTSKEVPSVLDSPETMLTPSLSPRAVKTGPPMNGRGNGTAGGVSGGHLSIDGGISMGAGPSAAACLRHSVHDNNDYLLRGGVDRTSVSTVSSPFGPTGERLSMGTAAELGLAANSRTRAGSVSSVGLMAGGNGNGSSSSSSSSSNSSISSNFDQPSPLNGPSAHKNSISSIASMASTSSTMSTASSSSTSTMFLPSLPAVSTTVPTAGGGLHGGVQNKTSTAATSDSARNSVSGSNGLSSNEANGVAQSPSKPQKITVKLHYLDDTFLLIMPAAVTYAELLERVERKVRLCGNQTPSPLRIKYKDEDDDFVTMRSDEDIQMAMELKMCGVPGEGGGSDVDGASRNSTGDVEGSSVSIIPGKLGSSRQDLIIWAA